MTIHCITAPPADEALEQLKLGNARFVAGTPSQLATTMQKLTSDGGQCPSAIVLGCSDSRVPVEIVFDQQVGDLFVIRVAGNIVAPSQIASIEFAAVEFGTQLVVVLGHTECGAVGATLDYLQRPDQTTTPGKLYSIVDRISPAVEPLIKRFPANSDELRKAAVRSNIAASVNRLREDSTVLADLLKGGQLTIVGAEYSLDDGLVTFLGDE